MEAREELKEVDEEIDKAVAGLYGITDDELKEIMKTFDLIMKNSYIENEVEGDEG